MRMNVERALRDRSKVIVAAGARVTAVVGFLAVTVMVASLALAEPKPAPPVTDKAGAHCRVDKDCKGPLPDICEKCVDGKTSCAHHACVDGTCETPICTPMVKLAGSCKTAADCKGMLPKLCEKCSDGKDACAHFACNEGKCETAICPTTSPTADSCTESSECKGPLPKLCEICKDGKEACAHWDCTAKKCQVQICP